MKLVKQNIERKDGSGSATLLPEEPEDMWHAYNLIRAGDVLRASAVRRVVTEGAASRSSERVTMTLSIRVTKQDFDAQAGQLHVSGRVTEGNKYVAAGSHHTLDLELRRAFTLEKAAGWDSVALERLRESTDETRNAQLWAVILQEGLANICLVTEHQTIVRQRVQVALPRKRAGSSEHEKAASRFLDTTLDTLLRQMEGAAEQQQQQQQQRPVLLASPGFTASNLLARIRERATAAAATTDGGKRLRALQQQVVVAHSSSGHVHSLAEVLGSAAVSAQLRETRFARETQLMDRLTELLRQDDLRAWYGPSECERAIAHGAVGRGGGALLISDALFRSPNVATRARWVRAVEAVRELGGEARVLSSAHESGARLDSLGGIAALLTYPLPDLDEHADEHAADHERIDDTAPAAHAADLHEDDDDDYDDRPEGARGRHELEEADLFGQ